MAGVAVTSDGPSQVLSVSELTALVRDLLEDAFPLLWVEAEISNLSRPASGHLYFSLKDERAQVRCALFRNRGRYLRFAPENGMRVKVRAQVGLYAARGDFQLVIEHMEQAGDGDLQRAFERLTAKLRQEGLFDPERKRTVPRFPRRVGVISSVSGAALRDILDVLGRRFPALPVLVYPVAVQGPESAKDIVRALTAAGSDGRCDTLILARGGGAMEDLQAFNEESVARAIAACPVPLVTGVGHETDTTIADFAADLRAPTPSAAAELVAPSAEALRQHLDNIEQRQRRHIRARLQQTVQSVDWLERRLISQEPARQLAQRRRQLVHAGARLAYGLERQLRMYKSCIDALGTRLMTCPPRQRLSDMRVRTTHLRDRIESVTRRQLTDRQARLALAGRALNAVSPLATLDRGYAILRHAEGDQLVTRAAQVSPGQDVIAKLSDGELLCRVEEVVKNP
jgi:exodeoxyribonuclease VII large subunit